MKTKTEIEKIFDEMVEHFGSVADPRFQPKKFRFQLKSYLFYKKRNEST